MGGSSVASPKRRRRIVRRARRIVPLTLLLLLSLTLLFFITARVVRAVLEARTTEQVRNGADIGVRPWMTIPYIARAHGIPEGELFDALGLTATERTRRAPLRALAEHNGRNLDADIAMLSALIAERRAPPRAPTPPRPPASPQAPGGNP